MIVERPVWDRKARGAAPRILTLNNIKKHWVAEYFRTLTGYCVRSSHERQLCCSIWRVPPNGRQADLKSVDTERYGVRFLYSPLNVCD